MSRAHDAWVEQQERDYQRLRIGGPGALAAPPDAESADLDACLLWIRRQGWLGRVEAWMIGWVRSTRTQSA